MNIPPENQTDKSAELVGSKIFGAFKAAPKAFRLFAEISDPHLRHTALLAASRATIRASTAAVRYNLELCATQFRQQPCDDAADDLAVAAFEAAEKGILPRSVSEIILEHLQRNSPEWLNSMRDTSTTAPMVPLGLQHTKANRTAAEIRSDIANLKPQSPEPSTDPDAPAL